ncbi:MAG: hypothetical protein QNL14_04985, partial [Deltaproteobacteria bacterium]|nr:hypothetical protein [Deltaproteobacteria bacterium]
LKRQFTEAQHLGHLIYPGSESNAEILTIQKNRLKFQATKSKSQINPNDQNSKAQTLDQIFFLANQLYHLWTKVAADRRQSVRRFWSLVIHS